MTATAATQAWREQSYNLSNAFFDSQTQKIQDPDTNKIRIVVISQDSKIMNQKAAYDLFNTIQDYSKTGCSKLLHQIWQVVRFIFTFGNTQWTATRNELTNVVKSDLKPLIVAHLPVKITDKIKAIVDADADTEDKKKELQDKLENQAAAQIIKQFDVKKAVNTLMLALLKIEKAGQPLVLSPNDTGLIKTSLARSILANNLDAYAEGVVKYLEPKDAKKREALLGEGENFNGNRRLVDHINRKITAAKAKQEAEQKEKV